MARLIVFLLALLPLASCTNRPNKKTVPMSTGYASVNGIRMYYEIHGEGQPLVLIHGGGSTLHTTFGNIMPALAERYQVIGVELQAHGHTSDRNAAVTFEQDADDIAALLDHLKIARANIFGFSNGGTTALQLAARHPGKVNRMIVASAAYQREGLLPGFFESMEHASLANMPKPLQDAFLAINPDHAALQNMHDKDKNRMIAFKDYPDSLLLSIQAPVLVVNGDKDVVTNEHAAKMARLLPTGHLMILPGNHGSYIGEICSVFPGSKIPALAVDAIIEFLQ